MKLKKLLALLLALVMVTSLALTACGGGEEDASAPSNDTEEEEANNNNDEEDDSNEEENDSGENLADNQELNLLLGSEPPCLDPQLSTDTTSSAIMNDTLEGMIRMDQDGVAKKGSGMAEDWDISDDGLTYTFYLRDAEWTDGEPVTAYDFEYSWLRALDPEVASQYAFLVYGIKNAEAYNTGEITDPAEVGIKALDEKTVEVVLAKPDPIFVSKLQHSTFFPARKDLIEEYGDQYAQDTDKVEWNGPFKVTEWTHEQSVTLEKNDSYWDKEAVKLEQINFTINNDPNTMINLYETDEIDYTGVPAQFIDKYLDDIEMVDKAATYWMVMNTEDEYLQNEKIRNAVGRTIDREAYNQNRSKGLTPSAYAYVSPGMPASPIAQTFREANGELFTDAHHGDEVVQEMNDLLDEGLAEIGKTREEFAENIAYKTMDSDSSLQAAQVFQQMWKENLGVEVGIDQSTWAIHLDMAHSGEMQFGYMGWVGDYNDPMTFMDLLITESSQNYSHWSNAEYDALIEKAQQTTDIEERMQAMLDAEKISMKEMPVAPYAYGADRLMERDYVKGIVRLPILVASGKKWAYVLEH